MATCLINYASFFACCFHSNFSVSHNLNKYALIITLLILKNQPGRSGGPIVS